MKQIGKFTISVCVIMWFIATLIILPGTVASDNMTIMEGVKDECIITIALGAVILLVTIFERGDSTSRSKISNVDKAINCLKMDKLDGHKGEEQLNRAMKYIMRERAERRTKEREAHRLAERQASSK